LGKEVGVSGSQRENGKKLVYCAYVGGVFLSPELEEAVSYFSNQHSGTKVAHIKCADLTVYDHRDSSVTAVTDWQHADLDWEAVRRAFNRPAFVQVKEKDGREYVVLLSISRSDREEKLEAQKPHFLLSLLRFPDGGPLNIVYPGAFWFRPFVGPDTWDAELAAITTGYIPSDALRSRKPLPKKVMVFQVNGQEGWHVLGSKVTQIDALDEELNQLIETS
jgi:hypothetical protein